MKITHDNLNILRSFGFYPVFESDLNGVWKNINPRLPDFEADIEKTINHYQILERMIDAAYRKGYNKALEDCGYAN